MVHHMRSHCMAKGTPTFRMSGLNWSSMHIFMWKCSTSRLTSVIRVFHSLKTHVLRKVQDLEKELRSIGMKLKTLEINEERALQRENAFSDLIANLKSRVKEVTRLIVCLLLTFPVGFRTPSLLALTAYAPHKSSLWGQVTSHAKVQSLSISRTCGFVFLPLAKSSSWKKSCALSATT